MTRRFYKNAWFALATMFCLFNLIFKDETKAVNDATWANPWYGLMTIIFIGLLVFCLSKYFYLAGRDREKEIWKRK